MVRTRGTVVEPAVGRDNGSRQGDVLSAQRGVVFVEGKEYRMMLGRTAGCSGVPQDAQSAAVWGGQKKNSPRWNADCGGLIEP